MKLVHEDKDLMGFINRKTYRCEKCGTEVSKEAHNTDPVSCPRCKNKTED